ncbi:MAG: hypothetical protein OER93_01975 [Thermoleophilia bacterium]|nr:hypothetical protein [Thermoleophilia bacterium]
MSKRRRLTAFLAVGAIGAGAALAGPALGHDPKSESGSHNGEKAAENGSVDPAKAERRAAKRAERMARRANRRAFRREVRKVGRMARRSMKHCHIAPDRLLTSETSKHLGLIKQIIDLHVEEGDLSPERAEMKYARWQQQVTVRTAMRTARWAPVLELFGVDSRKALRDMKEQAGGWRELLEAKDLSRKELWTAKREGMIDRWQVVVDLCNSGMDGEKPADGEEPANGKKPTNGETPKGGTEPTNGEAPAEPSASKGSTVPAA